MFSSKHIYTLSCQQTSRLIGLALLVVFALAACNLPNSTPTALAPATPGGLPAGTELPTSSADPTAAPTQFDDTLPPSALTVTPVDLPTPDPWTGKERVTILLLGLDYGDWDSADRAGPPRSDTMMLLTIDPETKTAGILSVPRDLWVTMPGIEGYHKINTAHRFGELYQMTGGGPGLAIRTVERLLGVPIQHYAVIDFYAFEEFIDELGGIELEVAEPISVDPIGEPDPFTLEPGYQTLDGPTALAYARNRYTADGDFDRARRQQQVIMAVRDKILRLNMLPTLVWRAPALYGSLSEGIKTDLSLQQIIQLAWFASQIEAGDIKQAVISNKHVKYGTAPDGQAYFQPVPSAILLVRDEIFGPQTTPVMGGQSDEEALNLGGAVNILITCRPDQEQAAQRTAEYLTSKGFIVVGVSVSEDAADSTDVYDYTGGGEKLQKLLEALPDLSDDVQTIDATPPGADIIINIGLNWQAP